MNPISFPEAAIVEVEMNLTKVAASDLSEKGQKTGFLCPTGSKIILTEGKQWLLSWFLRWSLPFETPPLRGHKICSGKNVHTIFVLVTPIKGTPLFRRKNHFFWVSKTGFNLPFGDTLVLKKRLTTKRVDKFHCSLVKMASDFKAWTISLKSTH